MQGLRGLVFLEWQSTEMVVSLEYRMEWLVVLALHKSCLTVRFPGRSPSHSYGSSTEQGKHLYLQLPKCRHKLLFFYLSKVMLFPTNWEVGRATSICLYGYWAASLHMYMVAFNQTVKELFWPIRWPLLLDSKLHWCRITSLEGTHRYNPYWSSNPITISHHGL